jgi:hypothetical protein
MLGDFIDFAEFTFATGDFATGSTTATSDFLTLITGDAAPFSPFLVF